VVVVTVAPAALDAVVSVGALSALAHAINTAIETKITVGKTRPPRAIATLLRGRSLLTVKRERSGRREVSCFGRWMR
jgi:hypothetical protein